MDPSELIFVSQEIVSWAKISFLFKHLLKIPAWQHAWR